MNGESRKLKAQSAMEYLMTYGWAILIIAVVLGTLFSLGIFSRSGLLGTSCITGAGYVCTGVMINYLNGNLSFLFGQSTGSTFYNVGFACAATSGTTGLPNPAAAMVYVTALGAATTTPANAPAAGALQLSPGQTIQVTGLKCFDAKGNPLVASSSRIGTAFSGTLWINYTLGSAAPGGSNPMIDTNYATLTTTTS